MRLWPLIATAFLAACTTPTERAERRVQYSCDRGPGITVRYSGDTAEIELPDGGRIALRQRPAGSGFWYESPTHSIRGKASEITYTVGRMVPMQCTASSATP